MARKENKQLRLDMPPVPSGLIDLSLLEGRNDEFVEWMRRARRNKKAREIFRGLRTLGIVDDDEGLLNLLEDGYMYTDEEASTTLRQADFKLTSQILNGTGRIWRDYFRDSSPSTVAFEATVSLRLGSIGHSAIVDLYRRNFPQYSWSELQSRLGNQEYSTTALFDQDTVSMYRPFTDDEYNSEDGFSGDYLGEIAFRTQFLSDLVGDDTDALLTDDFQGEFMRLTSQVAPLFSRQLYSAQQVAGNVDHYDKYVQTVLTWSRAATEILNQVSPVVFSEIPVFSWKRNGIGGGRIDALEVYGLDGYYLDSEMEEKLREMTSYSYSSVGDLLAQICAETNASRPEVKIVDFKMGVGDAQRHQAVIPAGEVKDGLRARDAAQVGAYLTLAPLDFASHVVDADTQLDDGLVWGERDPFYSGEVQYYFPNHPRVVHELVLGSDEKQQQFENYRENLQKARARAKIRSTDLTMGRVIEGIITEDQPKLPRGQALDMRIDSFLRGE